MSTASLSTRTTRFERPPVPVRRFTVAEYHRMGAGAVLTADDHVELLDGWIVSKIIHNPQHALAIENGQSTLLEVIPKEWRLRVQLPITTADSEPEPDFAIVRKKRPRRAEAHPSPTDIALVVEVSDSTLAQDRQLKAELYARARIPLYWIVNLIDQQVEVFSEPIGRGDNAKYSVQNKFARTKRLPLVIEGKNVAEIRVSDLLA